jgi:hypothetical protein
VQVYLPCQRRSQHLEGDAAIERNLPRLVDDPHPAGTQPLLDLEITDANAGFELISAERACRHDGGSPIALRKPRAARNRTISQVAVSMESTLNEQLRVLVFPLTLSSSTRSIARHDSAVPGEVALTTCPVGPAL